MYAYVQVQRAFIQSTNRLSLNGLVHVKPFSCKIGTDSQPKLCRRCGLAADARDEHEEQGMLMRTLKTLERVHADVFAAMQRCQDPTAWDVRRILHEARHKVRLLSQAQPIQERFSGKQWWSVQNFPF
jgi:hypothetical protein